MDIGIGLPATIPGTEGKAVIEWAREADQAGFSSLAVIDRLVYANYEPLVALAAAAAVTEKVTLTTSALLAPQRQNTPLLAKQASSLHELSGGRLVLGLVPGGRPDDFEATGVPIEQRGRIFDAQLAELKRIWAGEPRGFAGAIGPTPADGGPTLIVGGHVESSFRRVAEFGDGWMAGGVPPDVFAQLAAGVDRAWAQAGRAGRPRKLGLAYFALGAKARENADRYLRDYYAWLGRDVADQIAQSPAVSEEMVRGYVAAFEEKGCDELLLQPCSNDVEQVGLLAGAVLQS
jgi:alkanesulfonate monooxygenase SsuD/methylene tetrahydromethanopterin reductase-like flavin-dependent oxidoreductase (luciferase family)